MHVVGEWVDDTPLRTSGESRRGDTTAAERRSEALVAYLRRVRASGRKARRTARRALWRKPEVLEEIDRDPRGGLLLSRRHPGCGEPIFAGRRRPGMRCGSPAACICCSRPMGWATWSPAYRRPTVERRASCRGQELIPAHERVRCRVSTGRPYRPCHGRRGASRPRARARRGAAPARRGRAGWPTRAWDSSRFSSRCTSCSAPIRPGSQAASRRARGDRDLEARRASGYTAPPPRPARGRARRAGGRAYDRVDPVGERLKDPDEAAIESAGARAHARAARRSTGRASRSGSRWSPGARAPPTASIRTIGALAAGQGAR